MSLHRVLVGGVGYRYQRDASFGLHVSDALAGLSRVAGVDVEDLGYGALLVAQDIAAADPPYDRVILVTASVRDREPGLYERRPDPELPDEAEIQERVREAGGGVIDIDHLLIVGGYFGWLPADVRVFELEPVDVGGGEGLSPAAARHVEEAVARVRACALEPCPGREGGSTLAPAQPAPTGSVVGAAAEGGREG